MSIDIPTIVVSAGLGLLLAMTLALRWLARILRRRLRFSEETVVDLTLTVPVISLLAAAVVGMAWVSS
jgi:hypothetical protein